MKKTIYTMAFAMVLLSGLAAADTLVLNPNGQGAYSAWSNYGCGSGSSEWQCVDEYPSPDTTNYLYVYPTNRYESFVFPDTGAEHKTVNSVELHFYGRRGILSSFEFQPFVRVDGQDYLGSAIELTSTYTDYAQAFDYNPDTGNAWTQDDVDSLEAGMKSSSSTYGGRIAQVYAVVDYTLGTCSDTDGGFVDTIFGTVSGYTAGDESYSYSDYCIDGTTLREYWCTGVSPQSYDFDCAGNFTSVCSAGKCV